MNNEELIHWMQTLDEYRDFHVEMNSAANFLCERSKFWEKNGNHEMGEQEFEKAINGPADDDSTLDVWFSLK